MESRSSSNEARSSKLTVAVVTAGFIALIAWAFEAISQGSTFY